MLDSGWFQDLDLDGREMKKISLEYKDRVEHLKLVFLFNKLIFYFSFCCSW